jgi:aerobic carbon-monoxide dehydrogenase large subunit
VIGASAKSRDARRFVVGAGRYVDDLTRPGMAHLGVVRSAHARARVLDVDGRAATRIAGVIAVWAPADLPELKGPLTGASGSGAHKDRAFSVPVLTTEPRYVGEPIAIVVAESAALVADALAAVRVEYEPLPALPDTETARGSKSPLHAGWPDNVGVLVGGAVGDVEGALAQSGLVVVRERFRHQRLAAAPVETRGVVAEHDPASGTLTVWASIQSPYSQREAIARVLGLPTERVRVIVPDVGGAFGPKGQVYADEVLVALAATRLGRPVKWIETRREDFSSVGHDRAQSHEVTIAFTGAGTIAALDSTFVADVGAYPMMGNGLTANTVNHMPGPYRVPHYRGRGQSVVTTTMFNAAYRAAGRPEANFVMERLMDRGARALGLDPADVRRRNLVRGADMPYRPGLTYKDGVPVTYDPGDFPAAFERLLGLFGYEDWRKRQQATAGSPRPIGVGIACYAQGTGLGPFEGATVRVDAAGRVDVFIGVAAQGQDHATTLAQIAAESLGARLDDVTVFGGDTSLMPYGMGTGGSRVMANAGPAVARAAAEVRERAAVVAAEIFECAVADVRIEASRAFVAGMPDRALPLSRLAQAAVRSRALMPTGEPGLNACTWHYPDTVTWAFGGQACAVEVDVETGHVRLLRQVVLHDPGRAINPAIVEGQLQGGAAQAIGAALMEEVVYDADGQLLSGSFMDYAIPKADDLPPLLVALEENPSAINPLGVKGVGESGCIAGASAVANAVEDALADRGVVIRELPITPARLLALLR